MPPRDCPLPLPGAPADVPPGAEPEGRPLGRGATLVVPGPPLEAELPPGMFSPPPPGALLGSYPLP